MVVIAAGGLVGLVLPVLASVGGAPEVTPQASPTTVELAYRAYRKWDIVLPAEQFARVSGRVSNATCQGESFTAKLDGTALAIDTDGDGELDTTVTGKEDDAGNKAAVVTLRGTGRDGEPFTFSARLIDTGSGWQFSVAGAMVGMIGETKVQLIDQNNNGRYDDFGEDAMIVGRGKYATFLSRAMNVAGVLYEVAVAEDGSSLDLTPFDGDSGTLDMRSKLDTKGKLLSAIVKSRDGDFSFDLATFRRGVTVPAGTYDLYSAKLGLGKAEAYIRPGRMAAVEVAASETASVVWGGPVKGEFKYVRKGDQVAFSPDDVTYFGGAGEEYRVWDPVGKSPEFTIKEIKAGTEVAKALFPGSS
jgi:hypothetical protein